MPAQKVTFTNNTGYELAARLEMPIDQHPVAFALFAHCFTCNKNLTAVRNISRALFQNGIAVLRFDFAGLGESEGDFADTNFTSNIADLEAAAEYLREHYQAPTLLIGHSLGGAAVIHVADRIPEANAVITIGAPHDPAHVSHLLSAGSEELAAKGVAEVNIAGRQFKVKQQFLDDLNKHSQEDKISQLGRALLILHSPQDLTVPIENAARIYQEARHPKSFISLGGADHLLSDKMDSFYAGDVIACWVKRYLDIPTVNPLRSPHEVVVRLGNTGFTTDVQVRHHSLIADEPVSVGGNDFGPNPYELLSSALATCTAMTIQMYARRKKWPVEEVTVHVDHRRDYPVTVDAMEEKTAKIDHFDRVIELVGDLTDEQKVRILEIADKCPVHRTLHADVVVGTSLSAC